MNIYDCNLRYGTQIRPTGYRRCDTIEELILQAKRSGINGGFLRCVDTDYTGVVFGNAKLTRDLVKVRNAGLDMWGAWGMVPSCTRETPAPQDLFDQMKQNHIGSIYFNPQEHHYFPRKTVIGDYCAMAEEKKIPVIFVSDYGVDVNQADDILKDFPKLRAIIILCRHWNQGRQIYPFLEAYENVMIDTSYRWDDQGVEYVVQNYGAHRLMMGTGFPEHYMGGSIAHVHCAEISQQDKELIFSGNMIRLLEEAGLK